MVDPYDRDTVHDSWYVIPSGPLGRAYSLSRSMVPLLALGWVMDTDLVCKHYWDVSLKSVGGIVNTYLYKCRKCGEEQEVDE